MKISVMHITLTVQCVSLFIYMRCIKISTKFVNFLVCQPFYILYFPMYNPLHNIVRTEVN